MARGRGATFIHVLISPHLLSFFLPSLHPSGPFQAILALVDVALDILSATTTGRQAHFRASHISYLYRRTQCWGKIEWKIVLGLVNTGFHRQLILVQDSNIQRSVRR